MKYLSLNKSDITNGPGVRVSLFVSGCTHRCKGCHNPDGWSFDNGTKFSEFTVAEILDALAKPYISGLSILGGEPYDQTDVEELLGLVRKAKMLYPNKDIWIWTGYEFDQIKSSQLTKFIDVAVTGRFILDQRDISDGNRWRGSTNQKVIDVKASLESGKVIGLSGIPNNEV
jgi:anaerobic ribonucleoside-triphosphate reductase activating protein